jgi:hypothetical protein
MSQGPSSMNNSWTRRDYWGRFPWRQLREHRFSNRKLVVTLWQCWSEMNKFLACIFEYLAYQSYMRLQGICSTSRHPAADGLLCFCPVWRLRSLMNPWIRGHIKYSVAPGSPWQEPFWKLLQVSMYALVRCIFCQFFCSCWSLWTSRWHDRWVEYCESWRLQSLLAPPSLEFLCAPHAPPILVRPTWFIVAIQSPASWVAAAWHRGCRLNKRSASIL